MDYKTKPVSRRKLREYAKIMRDFFGVPQSGPFPVLEVLEQLPDVFPFSNYIVVDDKSLPAKTMAQCSLNEMGGFTIEIKETVYKGAFEKQIGAFLGFICHEICHVFLFEVGFVPVYSRSFAEKELPPYCSVEWQAKALCGEVMIPFEESARMGKNTIMEKYHVSQAFAEVRRKQKE